MITAEKNDLKSKTLLGDCMEIMSEFPDKHFDLAIVDPPYGIYGNSHRNNLSRNKLCWAKDYHNALWDQPIPPQEYFDELFRVSKNQIIWGINYFVGTRSLKIGGGTIVWDKVNGETNFSDAEIAYCSMIESVRIFSFMWNGMMQGSSFKNGKTMQGFKAKNEKRIHPTQKPVELYKWCFQKFSGKGQKILDTHLGSGSSRIAADIMGLDFTGIEIDKKYFDDQEARYQNHISQLKLELV